MTLVLVGATTVSPQDNSLANSTAEMRISLQLPKDAQILPMVDQEDVLYQLAFRPSKADYEIRCSFFSMQFFNRQSPLTDVKQLAVFHLTVLLNIAQNENAMRKMPQLYADELKNYYRADGFGWDMVVDGKSGFAGGAKYVAVAMIYKKDRGLAYVYALMNDDSVLRSEEFKRSIQCFRFDD